MLLRFLHAHFFATMEQTRDWTSLPVATLTGVLGGLEEQGTIVRRGVAELGEGWLHREDADLPDAAMPPSAFMLHAGDPLVRANASSLKRRYHEHEVLQYLLIDGAFAGAVTGHWRIGPHDVEDIVLDLPTAERERRRDEIVAAVATVYHPPEHRILRYAGAPA